jgi:S-adenosylmethionine-diacylglycerol 3-amino-3-carboxypropyl transferase
MELTSRFSNLTFKLIHTNNLVYNTCWEDPRCDRSLMNFDSDSKIVMITSAGCNALDYLLDSPAEIHAVDMNYRQNALLDLKKSSISNLDFETLFSVFGEGGRNDFDVYYYKYLRNNLSSQSQKYWDNNHSYLNAQGLRKSFYFHGTSGMFAWIFGQYLQLSNSLTKKIKDIFSANSLEEQSKLYNEIEPKVINNFSEWLMERKIVMYLLGVPTSQKEMIEGSETNSPVDFIKASLRKIFTTISVKDNYFYYVYFFGRYSRNNAPSYLQEGNKILLESQVNKLKSYTDSVSGFLEKNPGKYSHFVLLDHQDWMIKNDRIALEKEWELILDNAAPNAKILMRSAANEIDFIPDFVQSKIKIHSDEMAKYHALDRVGTYGSVLCATLN